MSFLWVDSGVTHVLPTAAHERKAENVSKIAAAQGVHQRVNDHEHDHEHENGTVKTPRKGEQAKNAYTDNQNLPVARNEIIAAQIMSRPVITIHESATTENIWKMLQENFFRHLPVTTPDQQQILGIVSDRSINQAIANASMNKTKPATISEIMRKPVLVATQDTNIRHIAKIMVSQRIGSIPIVDDNQHLLGIITRSDILNVIVRNHDLTLWV